MTRGPRSCMLLAVAVVLLFVANLLIGSVEIPFRTVVDILFGRAVEDTALQYIILESRLPQALTALLSGAALAVSGLMMQTVFRNPLAGPDVFGVNSGASLAVALLMLLPASLFSFSRLVMPLSTLATAFAGSMAVMGIILFFAVRVRSHVLLLIIGIMIGYLASSGVTLLNFFATEEGIHSFLMWGMGNFGGVSMAQMPLFAAVTVVGLLGSLSQVKSLNALLLGSQYAENLGVNIRRVRTNMLLLTGMLTAVVTAYCGPVAFLGLAVPHIARLLLSTENHRQLLPATMLAGAAVALLCNLACCLPGNGVVVPLNAVTPLVGAPVIIYVIARRR